MLKEAESWELPEYFHNDDHVSYYYTGRTDSGSPGEVKFNYCKNYLGENSMLSLRLSIPVWISELAKPDPRQLIKDPEALRALDRAIVQLTQVATKRLFWDLTQNAFLCRSNVRTERTY